MGLFDQFPYTNFHELNLDWILQALKELEHTIDQFVAINALKYADPIQWDITSQYEKNTIVIDPQTGTAYISVEPVPIGVALTNPDYWTVVFDLGSFVTRAAKNFTVRWEEDTTLTATFNTAAGEWLVWGDTLYKANVNITAGDSYIVDGNITRITVEEVKNEIYDTFNNIIGDIADLNTTDKSNLVSAINEVLTTLINTSGDLADLDTTDKSNLVAAINEVLSTLGTIAGDLADLNTTDKSNLVAAINEVLSTLGTTAGDLADLDTTDQSNLVAAINEVLSTLGTTTGDLADLTTVDKSNLVAAINEVNRAKTLVNVLDYGADPTGAHDSTAAFNLAFAALPSSNEIAPGGNGFYIPSGTYILNSEIDFTAKPVEIFGDGPNATRIIGWGSADPDSNYLTYFRVKRANIHDIRFEGDNNNCVCIRYVGGHNDNWTNNVYNCMFWWCLMGVQYSGAALHYSHNNCINMSLGIHFYGTSINSIIEDSFFGLYTQAIVTDMAHEGMTIVNNYFIGGSNSTDAVIFNGTSLSTIIDNNMFDQLYGTAGIRTIGAARDLKISNSWFGSNYDAKDCNVGIRISEGYYIKIDNCLFVDMKGTDIYMINGHDIIIDACADFYDDASSTGYGPKNSHSVAFTALCTRVRIVNSTFEPKNAGSYGVYANTGCAGIVSMCKTTTNNVLTVVNSIA